MLEYFFEIFECRQMENENRDFSYLFKGLDISKEEEIMDNHQGKYPGNITDINIYLNLI